VRVRARPLRDVSIRELRPLLDEEAAHWEAELHWDFTAVRAAVAGGVERGTLKGRALSDDVRVVAYSYYLGDVGRTIVGSIFAGRAHRGRGLEEELAEGVIAEARAEGGCGRLECQTLFCTGAGANDRFRDAGFENRRRHYMLLDLHRSFPPGEPQSPAGFRFRPVRRSDLHAAAEIVYRSHKGSIDAALNLTYATPSACRTFVDTLVLRAGCGRFDAEASRIVEGPKGPAGVLLASRLASTNGHVCQVSVVPEAQGHGLGLALMLTALRAFDREGLATCTLSVTADNERAHRLYDLLGFEVWREFAAHAWLRPPGRIELPS
jgi:ribosomal protein S18 acetylase RimI-like enzyme